MNRMSGIVKSRAAPGQRLPACQRAPTRACTPPTGCSRQLNQQRQAISARPQPSWHRRRHSVAASDHAHSLLKWQPHFNDLPTVVCHALAWERKLWTRARGPLRTRRFRLKSAPAWARTARHASPLQLGRATDRACSNRIFSDCSRTPMAPPLWSDGCSWSRQPGSGDVMRSHSA